MYVQNAKALSIVGRSIRICSKHKIKLNLKKAPQLTLEIVGASARFPSYLTPVVCMCLMAAICSPVSPSSSSTLMSAPRDTRSSTRAQWHWLMASSKGVCLRLFRTSISQWPYRKTRLSFS